MGKCLGCDKKLGSFEGYSADDAEFCKECYPKRKEFLNKKRTEEEKKEKENKEKSEKEDSREKEAKKILKLDNSEIKNKLVHKKAKNISKEKIEKIINEIKKYKNFKIISKIIYLVGIILWIIWKNIWITGLPLLIFISVAWFINSSRKSSLINELKKLKIV